jgi:hypothetical protein
VLPSDLVDQHHREWREQELTEGACGGAGAEGERPPFRRQQFAECTHHDHEGRAGKSEANDYAGRQMQGRRAARIGHQRKAERIENRPCAEHLRRAEAVRQGSGEGLAGTPEQHLNSKREREYVAAPAVCAGYRREEKPERGARSKAEHPDRATANQDDGRRTPTLAPTGGEPIDAERSNHGSRQGLNAPFLPKA